MASYIKKGTSVIIILTLMFFLAGTPSVVYAQWDYDEISVADTTLASSSPNGNLGDLIDVYLIWDNSTGGNTKRRALINFNLSSIPAGSIIKEATLRLYGSGYLADQRNLTVYRVSSNWTEMGATWVNADKSVPTPWGTPGGDYVLEGVSTKNINIWDWVEGLGCERNSSRLG